MSDARDCTCNRCVAACKHNPGWFAPGEVEKAAALIGMEVETFKLKFVIREFWCGDASTNGQDVFVYAPRKVGVDVGRSTASLWSAFTRARCVFLDERDRCSIHAAKPRECRETMCCTGHLDEWKATKAGIVSEWQAVGGAT